MYKGYNEKINELRHECEERELDATGYKSKLQNKLSEYLVSDGGNSKNHLFKLLFPVQINWSRTSKMS